MIDRTVLLAVCLTIFGISPAAAAETGQLKMVFQYGADPPDPKPLVVEQQCSAQKLFDESLIVDKQTKGIKNVIVYVYTGRGGSELPEFEPANETHTLANQNCRFEPHISVLQMGDTLRVTNPDPFGHNTNLQFLNNKAQNVIIASGQTRDILLDKRESRPIPIECNIHSFMRGYVLVLEHPYAGVSNDKGELVIEDLPAGGKLVFRAFHEAGSIGKVTVGGEPQEWRRGRFEIDIKPGMNDFGSIVVPAETFQ